MVIAERAKLIIAQRAAFPRLSDLEPEVAKDSLTRVRKLAGRIGQY
jgi:hypothetical protein